MQLLLSYQSKSYYTRKSSWADWLELQETLCGRARCLADVLQNFGHLGVLHIPIDSLWFLLLHRHMLPEAL